MPIDRPTEEGAVDDVHEDKGNGKARNQTQSHPRGTQVSRFCHDCAEDLTAGSAGGAEDSDFAGPFSDQGGEG